MVVWWGVVVSVVVVVVVGKMCGRHEISNISTPNVVVGCIMSRGRGTGHERTPTVN